MITKFTQYNENIKSLLIGPTKEEMWSELMNGKLKGFLKSVPNSPEDFFNQMKDGCKILDKNNHYIFWGKNNVTLFWHHVKNKKIYISYNYIWIYFNILYGFNYTETLSFIKNMLLEDINWRGLSPVEK